MSLAPLPPWMKLARLVVAVVALIYWSLSIWLPISGRPDAVGLIWAALALAIWYAPWFWFRSPWLWWPLYLISAVISINQVRQEIAACLVQTSSFATPFGQWPWSLQIVFGVSLLFAFCGAWQTVVLGVGRVRGFEPRQRRKRRM